MNSRKFLARMLLVVFLVFLVTGCQGRDKTIEPPQEVSPTDATGKDLDQNVSSEQVVEMGAYPSPWRKGTIKIKGQNEMNNGTFNADFYLASGDNQELVHQFNLGLDWTNPVEWVDDEKVLLHNTWLYDRANRKGRDLTPPGAEHVWVSALSSDGSLLAMTGKTSSSTAQIAVWIVHLETGAVKEVVSYPPNPGWTEGPGFRLSWDPSNNLYFDADFKGVPTIYRYGWGEKTPEVFLTEAWAPAVSPDGQHLAYLSGKGYYSYDSFRTKIREIESGKEIDTGLGGGVKYWSPNGNYLALFQGKDISYFRVAKYEGESSSLARQYTMKHPGSLRLIEFVDYSHMLVQESVAEGLLIKEAKYFVFGPDEQSGKVWEAARDYMEDKGYTVGLRYGDMVLAVGHVFGKRALVGYGPMASEFYAELLLEEDGGNWKVVIDQHSYSYYADELAVEAMQALASREGLDYGWEPGKTRVGVKDQDQDRITLIVGQYGWPWSHEYDMEKVNGTWKVVGKRELQ
ncbi:MAG: TolB family protein [Bacillota bacterium]